MRSIDAPAWRIALFTTTSTRPQSARTAPRASTTSPTSSRSIGSTGRVGRAPRSRPRSTRGCRGCDDRLLAADRVGLGAAFALALRAGGDGDVEARLGELERRCLADAPAGAGDQCDGGGGRWRPNLRPRSCTRRLGRGGGGGRRPRARRDGAGDDVGVDLVGQREPGGVTALDLVDGGIRPTDPTRARSVAPGRAALFRLCGRPRRGRHGCIRREGRGGDRRGERIGRAIALELAGRGADIAVADVNEERLAETAAAVSATGRGVLTQRCDVRSDAEVDAFRDATIDRFGQVDVLCNNAGVAVLGPPERVEMADWEWILQINVLGLAAACERSSRRCWPAAADTSSTRRRSPDLGLHVGRHAVHHVQVRRLRVLGRAGARPQAAGHRRVGLCPGLVTTNLAETARFLRRAARAAGPGTSTSRPRCRCR